MRAILTRAWSEVRRRRLQSAVIAVMVALTSATITLGLNLLQESSSPYDHAFEAQRGAHLKVFYDAGRVTPGQLASTPATIGAGSSAGPWPDVQVTVLHPESPRGQSRYPLDLVGRDSPQGPVEELRMISGRWAQAPGEVVVNRAFAESNRVGLGDHLVSLHTAGKPVLTVVGEAVDIDQASAASSINGAQRAWVPPSQVADLAGGSGLGYEMAYRFLSAPGQAQLRDDAARLQSSLPPGAVTGSFNYLLMRDAYTFSNQYLLDFLIAFGIFALVASLATMANLVLGTVLASYREIGILKALGFTPLQVVASLVAGMGIPALAGCVIGIPAGTALSLPLLDQAAQAIALPSQPAVSPLAEVLALAGILACVVAATALPALRAGRMSVVEAISAGGAPPSPRAWRPSHWLEQLRLPRPLSLGARDAFVRPLRGILTVVSVMVGVATIVFAFGIRGAVTWYPPVAAQLDGDVSVARESTVSDGQVMAILGGQAQTRQVLAVGHAPVVIAGLADPVDGLAFRGDPLRFGWSNFLDRGRWVGSSPGEVLLPRAVLDAAHLDVGSSVDGVVAGRPLRLHVVGEVTALGAGLQAWLDWSTLAAVQPDAQPVSYAVQLRPGSDADGYAAVVQAREPDFLTVAVNHALSDSVIVAMNALMLVLALVLGLIAAVGVFSTMLLHVRERTRDIAILKAVGMSPGQLLAMVMTSAAVLGVIGGLAGLPAGVLTYRGLTTELAHQIGDDLPPHLLDVLGPTVLYPLALTGLAIALAGAILPARRAARSPVAEILRSE
jgi:putative ABC transport system permease protein